MIKYLTSKLSVSTITATLILSTSSAFAEPLMSKAQYADYSVAYQCAQIQYHNDLNKQEEQLIKIEDKYGLTDDNFDEFDELVTEYERDDSLLDDIRVRVSSECTKSA